MAHLRQQIREAIATALSGLSTTGSRVYTSRVYPVQTADLPCLLIYADSERSNALTISCPRPLERSVQFRVEAYAKATSDLDDTLDQICVEVERALAMPVSALVGIVRSITLDSTELELVSAEKPTGRARLAYTVDYFVAEDAPDVAL